METIKKCKYHGETTFVFEKRGYYRCRKCRVNAVTKRRQKVKKILVDYKGGKCVCCGYNKCLNALDFHHNTDDKKEFSLSSGKRTLSMNKMKKEVDKCVLVCSNCHREIHAGIRKIEQEFSYSQAN